jgi:hypothetical protein
MRWAVLCFVLISFVGAPWAHAFVQDRSPKTGALLRWKGGTVALTLARSAPSQDLRDSEVRRAVAAALDAWDRRNNPCSSIELRLAEHTTDNEVLEDGLMSLSFRAGTQAHGQAGGGRSPLQQRRSLGALCRDVPHRIAGALASPPPIVRG